jgi:hypothetical protein
VISNLGSRPFPIPSRTAQWRQKVRNNDQHENNFVEKHVAYWTFKPENALTTNVNVAGNRNG